jgi:hypothetical protein
MLLPSHKPSEIDHSACVKQGMSDHRHQEISGPCEEETQIETLKYRPETYDPHFLLANMAEHEEK